VCDRFPIRKVLKHGDALKPMIFNFALHYAIRRFKVKRNCLKINGTHQLLAYADDVSIISVSVHTIKGNEITLVAATMEVGVEEVLIKLSTWSCLEVRMQDEFRV